MNSLKLEARGPLVQLNNLKGKESWYKIVVNTRNIIVETDGSLKVDSSHSDSLEHFVKVWVNVREKTDRNGNIKAPHVAELLIPARNYDEVIQILDLITETKESDKK